MILENAGQLRFINGGNEMKEIPQSVYLLEFDDFRNEFYLQKQPDFTLPEKVYGNLDPLVERYLNTFKDRGRNMGILLKGLKGTGKSLLAKKICIDSGLPVILITKPYGGTTFEKFITSIEQECVMFLDEFEKTYSSMDGQGRGQDGLLSILDGVFSGKKLFLLTCNNDLAINDALLNRPSRILYSKEYSGLEEEIIDAIIDDLLEDKSHKEALKKICFMVGDINVDSLVTIIEEMNRYSESPSEVMQYLNIKPENASYDVRFVKKVKVYTKDNWDIIRRNRLLEGGEPVPYKEKEVEFVTYNINNPMIEGGVYAHAYASTKGLDQENDNFSKTHEIDLDFDECDVDFISDNQMMITDENGQKYFVTKEKKNDKTFVF